MRAAPLVLHEAIGGSCRADPVEVDEMRIGVAGRIIALVVY